jgi:preprotein translocase subunit SecA
MRPVYELLGLTVGVIETPDAGPAPAGLRLRRHLRDGQGVRFRLPARSAAAAPDGSARSDFWGRGAANGGTRGAKAGAARSPYFALVDEADSILIDEARTPLIIGSLGDKAREQVVATYQWAASTRAQFVEDDVTTTTTTTPRKPELTAKGRQFLRAFPKPEVASVGLVDLYQYMERAIKVHREYHLDRQYVVRDGEIVIVDEFTGRLAEGRKWRDGIHQAIEAKKASKSPWPPARRRGSPSRICSCGTATWPA